MVKNILIISSYFAPAYSYGGPPKVLYTLAKELARKKMHVTVLTTDALDEKRNKISQEVLEEVKVIRFNIISNTLAYKAKIFLVFNLLNKAKKYIDRSDVILFSDLRTIINWQLYRYTIKKEIPYGIFPFGQIPLGSGFLSIIKKMFDKLWVRDFVDNARWCFFQTKHEQEMLIKYFHKTQDKTHFLPLPIEINEYNIDKREMNEFKGRWDLKLSDFILLFVGRLHHLKGVDLLIDRVTPLLKKDNNLKLMIVGRDDGDEGTLKRGIAQSVKNQIIFTGPLYTKEAAKVYACANIFLYTPRFFEETSLAALEALSYGLPVVATIQADMPYLMQYKAGIIAGDISQIPKYILEIHKQLNTDGNKIRENAYKLINEHYLSEKIVKKLIEKINIV